MGPTAASGDNAARLDSADRRPRIGVAQAHAGEPRGSRPPSAALDPDDAPAGGARSGGSLLAARAIRRAADHRSPRTAGAEGRDHPRSGTAQPRRPGPRITLDVDHVIAATGYRFDTSRLGFLDPTVREGI